MPRPILTYLLAVGLGLLGGHALAADFTVIPQGATTLVFVVGTIVPEDADRLSAALVGRSGVTVVMESDGGSLAGGLAMGRAIRTAGADTAVVSGQSCASACALAWLGGARRFMGPGSRVGFHAAYRLSPMLGPIESGQGNALVGYYAAQLGLPERAVAYITQAHPEEMQWLSIDDAANLGIGVLPFEGSPQTAAVAPPVRLPSSQAPVAPSAENAARAFVFELAAHWSASNAELMPFLAHAYADAVNFYGDRRNPDFILKFKRTYAERWPERSYRIRDGSLRVACQPDLTCNVDGIADWDFRSPARNARSVGAGSFGLGILLGANGPRIVSETSAVIARHVDAPP